MVFFKKKIKIVTDCIAAEIYKLPLFDLGSNGNDKLLGILSPIHDDTLVKKYVKSQFLKSAQGYFEKYQNIEYFKYLISTAFQRININPEDELIILDVGSGAGNTIFPLLTLCPNSHLIASDLSIEMLAILKKELKKFIIDQNMDRNCFLLQLNAEDLNFVEESFDLIIGGSILHHMISPGKTMSECARVLKKGGYAIFFEPFEEGNMILWCVYNTILNDSRKNTLSKDVIRFLRALIVEYDCRMVRHKSLNQLRRMDDKWFFNKRYFFDLAEEYKFSDCIIYPLHQTEHQFSNQTVSFLRLGKGMERDALPDWSWEIIQQFDQCFSEDAKKELLIEGCLILKK